MKGGAVHRTSVRAVSVEDVLIVERSKLLALEELIFEAVEHGDRLYLSSAAAHGVIAIINATSTALDTLSRRLPPSSLLLRLEPTAGDQP